ncbi:uncharacterized protein LOC131656571 isoform X2 [Vicia villosa]|uniref:uncharacterized protein LOC131656571 isoform X2 n=1 Tax=Vicia villosa TaxID=3911 RepID=UPI00273BD2F3|nr:uncharacterized protein LOC131656571 isoform X2 [Vicia villosa]
MAYTFPHSKILMTLNKLLNGRNRNASTLQLSFENPSPPTFSSSRLSYVGKKFRSSWLLMLYCEMRVLVTRFWLAKLLKFSVYVKSIMSQLWVILRKLHQVVTPSTYLDGNIGPDATHLLAIKEVFTYQYHCSLVNYFCVLFQVFVLYSDAKCSYFELSSAKRIVYFLQESNGSDNCQCYKFLLICFQK